DDPAPTADGEVAIRQAAAGRLVGPRYGARAMDERRSLRGQDSAQLLAAAGGGFPRSLRSQVAAGILEVGGNALRREGLASFFADCAEPPRARPRRDGREPPALRRRGPDPGRTRARPRDAAAG